MRTTVRIRMRDRLLAVLALVGFLLVCFAASAVRRPEHAAPLQDYGVASPSRTKSASQKDIAGKPPKPFHLRFPHWLLTDLLWFGAALGLGLLIWAIVKVGPLLSRPRRRRGRRRRREAQDAAPVEFNRETQDQLTRAFSEALAGFDIGDSNRAIVACWIRLEQIAEEVGFARQTWETSSELVTRWLSGWNLPTEPLNRLAELYREARYSGHPMSRAQIELARSTLTGLRLAFQPIPAGNSDDGLAIDHG